MSREDPIKAEKDLLALLDKQFPEIEKFPYKEGVEKLLQLEKQTRQALDVLSSKRVLKQIATILIDNNDWDYLDELIVSLSKKHGQLKLSIQEFIQTIIARLPDLDDKNKKQVETKIKVIETIRTVTDKKIFVEVERAQVLRILAEIYLNQFKDLDKAVDILCDLQVETYSMMNFSDKIEYILEQIDLTLQKGDYAQAKVLLRKIMLKLLKLYPEFKKTYLQYLIRILTHEYDYLSTVQHALMLLDLEALPELAVLVVYYIILAKHNPEQHDLILKIKLNPHVTKLVSLHVFHLLELFTTDELIHWHDINRDYADEFAKLEIFKDETNFKNLQKRIIEHNLRTINKYYTQIQLPRLAELLQLLVDDLEQYVLELVNLGMISAKINRPEGIIRFSAPGTSLKALDLSRINDTLNSWCHNVDKLLEEIDSIGHLINKEEMMHGIKQKA